MAKKDYIPKRYADIRLWEQTFINQIDAIAATLGISAAEVSAIKNTLGHHMSLREEAYKKKRESEAATKEFLAVGKTALKEVRRFGTYIKSSPGYNPGMGKALGIICPEVEINYTTLKPRLKLLATQNGVRISFSKPGNLSGVKIYSRRGTENQFTFLGVDTQSPYQDKRPNLIENTPERREYYAVLFNDDDEVGKPSNIAGIVI